MSIAPRLGLLAIVVLLPNATCTMIGASEVRGPSPAAPGGDPDLGVRGNEGLTGLGDIPDPVPVFEEPSRYGNMVGYDEFGGSYRVLETSEGYQESGIASWYGDPFRGRRTNSR